MIDIGYYRKIQNAYGAGNLRDTQRNQIKMDLNRDFNNTLDAYSVVIDGIKQDLTILKTTRLDKKKIKSRPNENFTSGQIIEWMDAHWLITEVDRCDDISTTGKMQECNYQLYWQNSEGKIINKWAYIQNASSYSNGESGNATLTLSSNQFLVQMPLDEDTINLNGTRMIIDNVTNDKPTPYELTRPDNVTMKFGEKGCTYYIFTLKQLGSDDKDKKVTLEDGTQVWICNYTAPTTITDPGENPDKTTVCLTISSTKDILKLGGQYTTFKGIVKNTDNYMTDDFGTFNIVSDFSDKITTLVSNNQIKIKISDSYTDLVGKTFELVFAVGNVSVSKTIRIED